MQLPGQVIINRHGAHEALYTYIPKLSSSGQPFNGPDIGGFEGNCNKDLPTLDGTELLSISRNHSSNNR